MFRLTWLLTAKSLRLRFWRFVLSGFGILIGVAGMFSIAIANQNALQSITELFQGTSGNAKLSIVTAGTEGNGFPERILISSASVPGVASTIPLIKIQTSIAGIREESEIGLGLFGLNTGGLQVYGIDPILDQQARDYQVIEGRFIESADRTREIVLVKDYAEDNEIRVGQWIGLATPAGIERVKVVGLMSKEGPARENNGAFGVLPLMAAQEMYQRVGSLDRIDILTAEQELSREDLEDLRGRLQARIGEQVSVIYPASQGQRMTQMLQNYQIGLNFISGIALFVGAFLIYNAFAMTVVERTREFGMLRSIGMTKNQIMSQVMIEATLIGSIGSLLGIVAGFLLANGLTRLMANVINQPLTLTEIPLKEAVFNGSIGLGVTLIAASIPAWQAGRISPMEALRVKSKSSGGWVIRKGWIIGILLLAASTAILIWNPFPYDVQFRMGSVTVFGLLTGATLLIPVLLTGWEYISRPFIKLLYGASGTLGSRNIQRSILRTTLTVAVLMVGSVMIITTRGMTDSFEGDLSSWSEAYIGGDIYIGSSNPMRNDIGDIIKSVKGVESVSAVRYFPVTWQPPEGETQQLSFMAYNPIAYSNVASYIFSDKKAETESVVSQLANGNAILLSSVLSEKSGLTTGDTVRLRTRSGWRSFTIAGVVVDFYNQGMAIQGTLNDMQRHFRIDDITTYIVKVENGEEISMIRDRIDNLYSERYHLVLESNESLKNRIKSLLEQSSSTFDIMILLAIVVGALGVLNTLLMNVMERIREIGMLRAIGMLRSQIVQMILAEAGLMGLLGGILGLATGVILARVLFLGMTTMSGYQLTFVLANDALIITIIVAYVVSQIAAIIPSWSSANLKILEAIHHE